MSYIVKLIHIKWRSCRWRVLWNYRHRPLLQLGRGFIMIPVGRTKLLRYLYNLQLLARCSRSCTRSQHDATESSITSHFITNVGTASLSSPSQWNFTHRHIVILNVIACAVTLYFSLSLSLFLVIYPCLPFGKIFYLQCYIMLYF